MNAVFWIIGVVATLTVAYGLLVLGILAWDRLSRSDGLENGWVCTDPVTFEDRRAEGGDQP